MQRENQSGTQRVLACGPKLGATKSSKTWELGPRHENESRARGITRVRRPDREQDREKLHLKIKPVNGNEIYGTIFLNKKRGLLTSGEPAEAEKNDELVSATKSSSRADETGRWKIKSRLAARKTNLSEGQIWPAKKTNTGQGYPAAARLNSQNQTKTNQARLAKLENFLHINEQDSHTMEVTVLPPSFNWKQKSVYGILTLI
jgi:hypothetical protein